PTCTTASSTSSSRSAAATIVVSWSRSACRGDGTPVQPGIWSGSWNSYCGSVRLQPDVRRLPMTRVALSIVIAATIGVVGSAQQQTSASVSFSKDVAPILQKSCQNCHRPGAIARMSLLTYQDARPWARSIKAKVTAREMPPWYIDRHIGITKFKDDPSLTDAEIATIVKWVDAGAPAGNPKDMPEPRQ